jgi:hypothetical protein
MHHANTPIPRPRLNPVQRLLAELPGWIFLIGGAVLVAAVVLGRGRFDNAPLIWQRDLLEAQARQLDARRDAYQTLRTALDEGDPVLLERLAFEYLRLQPRDRLLLAAADGPAPGRVNRWPLAITPAGPATPAGPTGPASAVSTTSAAREREFVPAIDRTVEASLNRPLSREGLDVPPFEPDRSLLARLAQGWSAPGLVGVGGMLIVAGLLWSPTSSGRVGRDERDGRAGAAGKPAR